MILIIALGLQSLVEVDYGMEETQQHTPSKKGGEPGLIE